MGRCEVSGTSKPFAAEAQMDKLAKALSLDPVEFRLLNALETGDILITGQEILERSSQGSSYFSCRISSSRTY